MILLIDNYDSFTWNLVQRLGEIDRSLAVGRDLVVMRNDAVTPEAVETIAGGRPPTRIIISPGPCTPNEAGVSGAVIRRFEGRVPILGVCLGHQCMAAFNGMTVGRHAIPMHGKTSPIHHDGRGLFAGLSNPFEATRYHSLVVFPDTVPARAEGEDGWEVSAWTEDRVPARGSGHAGARGGTPEGGGAEPRRVIMGMRRVWATPGRAPVEGVQFHPESFLTTQGPRLLANFLAMR